MIFQYLPTKKFVIDNIPLEFGLHREVVRAKLGGEHSEQNEIFSFDDADPPIIQRRDIYDKHLTTGDHFFLNYNADDLLIELEIHRCKKIKIFDIEFDFEDELELIAAELSAHATVTQQQEGEYFFRELHLLMIDEWRMGGEEKNRLSYFYCASDISHIGD